MSILAIVAPYMGAFIAGTTIGGAMGFGLAAILTAGRRADEDDARAMNITTVIECGDGNPELAERIFAGDGWPMQDRPPPPPYAPLRLVPRDQATPPPPPRR